MMIQPTHLGRRTAYHNGGWLSVLATSFVQETAHRTFPKAAEDWDIARIAADYAASAASSSAAARMQAAGLDGIEIEAYGHLMDGFWSPAINLRDDAYNGTRDRHLRFLWGAIEVMRAAAGKAFIIGIRMVADAQWDEGLSHAEGDEITRRLAGSGPFDFITLIRGRIDTDAALPHVIPIRGMASVPPLDLARDVWAESRILVFHAVKISDVATARHAITSGKLGMVGMTRAHRADPHIVRKIKEGTENRIGPCVGAPSCPDRIDEGGGALCIHNAATGREARLPHVISRAPMPRHAVIVGAGPGGLEAARVAAERGHSLTVLEPANAAGARPG